MKTTPSSEVRRNSAAAVDGVDADREPVIIECDRGKPAAMVLSVEDLASLEETAYLLRSPGNAERLLGSIAELDRGGGTERDSPA